MVLSYILKYGGRVKSLIQKNGLAREVKIYTLVIQKYGACYLELTNQKNWLNLSFSGPQGSGKEAIAIKFAQLINCEQIVRISM